MTSHHGRLYALAASVLLFFVAWALIAAHPWASAKAASRDPRLVALAQREHRLRKEAGLVQEVVARRYSDYRRRFAAYKVALARRQAQIVAAQKAAAAQAAQLASVQQPAYAAAPSGGGSVRVVSLPPLVITRTS
jgi:pyruvate/2-oxoglutarate dehydrogenase complex dihydrolipoamide acyltransferase (E2) component